MRVPMQYNQIHHMKDMLHPGKDIYVQLDYAENWSAMYLREISSGYYDKKMITVHPMAENGLRFVSMSHSKIVKMSHFMSELSHYFKPVFFKMSHYLLLY